MVYQADENFMQEYNASVVSELCHGEGLPTMAGSTSFGPYNEACHTEACEGHSDPGQCTRYSISAVRACVCHIMRKLAADADGTPPRTLLLLLR